MSNLKKLNTIVILGIIVIGIIIFIFYNGTADYSEKCELNVGNSIENAKCYVDLCENLTGTEKAVCYVNKNLSSLNVSLEICRGLKQEFTNTDAVCMAKISSIVSRKNPEVALSICDEVDNTPSDVDGEVSMRCYENIVPFFPLM